MNTSLSITEKIKVGFQKRSDTYTGKLAYVIPMDSKGKLRKEKSFESWRDQDVEPEVFENEPTSGFVLNKKTGWYDTGWSHRKTYVRVYDPRGFEFEISVENLLYILEHTSSIVGKGLEGEFLYSWSGKDLVLLPANAPEYKGILEKEENEKLQEYVSSRNLVVGATYLTKENQKIVYLGKFEEYKHDWQSYAVSKKAKKQFYFGMPRLENTEDEYISILTFPNLTRKLIAVVDESEHPKFQEIMLELEKKTYYSPIDHSKTVVEPMTLDEVKEILSKNRYYGGQYAPVEAKNEGDYCISENKDGSYSFGGEKETNYFGLTRNLPNTYEGKKYDVNTLEEIMGILKPTVKHYYQENGRHYKASYY